MWNRCCFQKARQGWSHSEIRLGCFWNGNLETDKIVVVVLGTNDFPERLLHAPPALHAPVRHCEDPRVLDVDGDIDRTSVGRKLPAFDHVQSLATRRAVIIDKA